MKVCPVVDPDLPISELNEATRPGTPVPKRIARFAIECIQCGRCDTVCPTSAGRSIMMLYLKAKLTLAKRQPRAYKNYLALKGHDRNSLLIGAFNLLNKPRIRKLARHVDKQDFKRVPLLFYLGCYVFSPTRSAVELIEIADRLGLDYEVLAGFRSCCGWPQLLAGSTDRAEDYHGYLLSLIEKSSPREVVTGCAECFASLVKIKRKYKSDFEVLTPSMWLLRHVDGLDITKSNEKVTYHDSCHISRKFHHPEPARELLAKLVNVVEMKRSGARDTYCCGYWGFKANSDQLEAVHAERFTEARGTGARKMIVECVTCLESFALHPNNDVEVQDIIGLVIERSRLMRDLQ
jgi:Fe-S oxidoreductase